MKWRGRLGWTIACLIWAIQWSAGCGDSNDSAGGEGRDTEGLVMCCELGAVCHDVGQQDADEAECHEIGHLNNPSECRANYERCMDLCGGSGEGGAGGESEPHACVEEAQDQD